jgi:HSP20 family protein
MSTQVAERTKKMVRPACRIEEHEGAVALQLEMPGVNRELVDINIDGDTLTIDGHRSEMEGETTYLLRERRGGDFRAVYTIDQRVDRQKVEARMEHGVLHVTLHLKEEVKPRKIEVAE